MDYFKLSEFDCKHTGRNEMDPVFIERLNMLRAACGFPFIITSGYRDKTHPVEARKAKPGTGTHAMGIAADIAANTGSIRGKIVQEAINLGFTGIGVAQTFVHVDTRKSGELIIWSY